MPPNATTAPATPTRAGPGLLATVAAVALLCALTGWAALLFAIPPGHASPLNPATGVALAALLAFGPRCAWAVGAGSFAVHLLLGWQRGESAGVLGLLPLVIALGATAQALLGAALVRRCVEAPLTLDSPGAIARFYGCGGLLACTVGATVGVGALAVAGLVPAGQLALTWLIWWSGDTLGVVVMAPAALAFVGQPAQAWRPRRSAVALPLLVALGLLAAAIWQEGRWQRARDNARFERDALAVIRGVELRLSSHLDALDALHGLYIASDNVDADEFRRATAVWLSKLPSVQALGWHERVAREALPAFEAAARAEGHVDYRVYDREPMPASEPAVYALRRIEPRRGNDIALGVNPRSIPAARTAIDLAERSDAAVASAAFRLTQTSDQQAGVVVYRAVHGPQGPAGGPPLGMVFVTMRMEDALARLIDRAPEYLQICLIDTDALPAQRRLAGPAACADAPGGAGLQRSALPFAGRHWELRVLADGGIGARSGSDRGAAWLFSLTALAAAGMMGALLLIVTGRARRTEAAVTDRTEELREQIAERRLAEQALRQSERRFRDIFQAVPIGVAYTDLNGRIEQPNAAYCRMTGYSEPELLGMAVSTLTHPEDRAADRAALDGLLAGRLPLARLRKRCLTKDGAVLQVLSTVSLLRDDSGAPHRIVGLIEDISEQLKLEAAESARERAEASSRAKSDFLSRMSHELRTPLNGMLGFAQLLELDREALLSERHQRWVAQIQQAGWHLLDMINDVLDLSRIESGTLQLQPEPLALEPLIVASMALVAPQAAARNIDLRRELETHAPLQVMADATRVKQILTNLLSNAIKYNRDGGKVLIATHVPAPDGGGAEAMVELTVTDTGVGMTPAQLAQLFQPFNRLGRERGETEGTGIGLVIARLLAERHGGSLDATSTPGNGSTFRLRLPLTADFAAHSESGALDEDGGIGYHSRHVLYIEDNDINIEVMRGILTRRPQVLLSVAASGLDGLAAVRTTPPDLVLLDMNLPDISGMALLQHLKADERTAEIPVVVVSADAMPAQIQAALAAGAARYLTKPVSVEDTLAVIDELLGQAVTRFG